MTRRQRFLVFAVLVGGLIFVALNWTASEGGGREYRFDQSGRLETLKTPDGNRIRYRWTTGGYVDEVRFRGGWVKYGYDPAGMLAWVQDNRSLTQYYRDPLGRVADVVWHRDVSRLIRYEYDSTNKITSLTVYNLDAATRAGRVPEPDTNLAVAPPSVAQAWKTRRAAVFAISDLLGQTNDFTEYRVRYHYDAVGNLEDVDAPSGRIAYTYRPANRIVERRLPNGISTTRELDLDGRIRRVTHLDTSGALLAEFRYVWNEDGRLGSLSEAGPGGVREGVLQWDNGRLNGIAVSNEPGVQLTYGERGQLTAIASAEHSLQIEYDDRGNIVRSGPFRWTADPNGWADSLSVAGSRLDVRYDGRGLPARLSDEHGRLTCDYDFAGHLAAVRGRDERHILADPLSDDDLPLLTWDKTGRVVSSAVYGREPIAHRDGVGAISYPLTDGLGDVRLVADAEGATRRIGSSLFDASAIGLLAARQAASRTDPRRAQTSWWPRVAQIAYAADETARSKGLTLSDVDAGAEWARFITNEQYFRLASLDSSEVPGLLYDQKIKLKFDAFLRATPSRSINVYLKGISNGWSEIGVDSRFRCPDGDCIFLPTFGSMPKQLHLIGTLFEKVMGAVPLGNLLMTRKLDWPGLIEATRRAGKTLNSIVCESGCGLELERSLPSLQQYAARHPGTRLPAIVVQSTDIGPTLRHRLETAGYAVHLETEDGLVPRVVAAPADYAGPLGRIPGIGPLIGLPIQTVAALGFIGKQVIGHRSIIGAHGVDLHWDNIQAIIDASQSPVPALRDARPSELRRLFPPARDAGNPSAQRLTPPDPFDDPFPRLQRKLGGIALDVRGEAESDVGSIAGVVYDAARGRVVLLGRRSATISETRLPDLAVALRWAYGNHRSFPQFSLNPADPSNPQGPWLKLVFLPEFLSRTAFGRTMFLADWRMKQLSFGVSVDSAGTAVRLETMPAGLRDVFSLTLARPEISKDEEWTRLWIVAADFRWKMADDAVVFTSARMAVKAKRQVVDPRSETGLRDVEDAVNPASAQFAHDLTTQYTEVAHSAPEFGRLVEMAKAVAIARWLREHNAPIDGSWQSRQIDSASTGPERVPALSDSREERKQTQSVAGNTIATRTSVRSVHLFGGIDLTVRPTPDGAADGVSKPVSEALESDRSVRQTTVHTPGGDLIATVLPITSAGRPLDTGARVVRTGAITREYSADGTLSRRTSETDGVSLDYHRVDGVLVSVSERQDGRLVADHRVDDAGRVSRSEHVEGIVTYEYGSNGKLATVTAESVAGERRVGKATPSGTEWVTARPLYEPVTREYDEHGFLKRTAFEGRRSASYEYHDSPLGPPANTPERSDPVLPITSYPQTAAGVNAGLGPRQVRVGRQRRRGWLSRLLGARNSQLDLFVEPTRSSIELSDTAQSDRARQAKALSTPETVFVSVGHASRQGQAVIGIQIGSEQMELSRSEFDSFLDADDPPNDLQTAISSRERLSRVLVLTPPGAAAVTESESVAEVDALRFIQAVTRWYGHQLDAYLATDAAEGLRNAAKLPLVRGSADLAALVPSDGFRVKDYGLMQDLRGQLTQFGIEVSDGIRMIERGSILVISAHKDVGLAEYMESLGGHGVLRGKYIVLFSCYCRGDVAFNAHLIRDFGATGIHFFSEDINAEAVRRGLLELGRSLSDQQRRPNALERLLRESIERAANSETIKRLRGEIEKLRRGITQVSDAWSPVWTLAHV